MLDFLMISTRTPKRGLIEIYPKFIIKRSSDLMIRGGDFYAIWIEERGLWSTDEQDALQLIDKELDNYIKNHSEHFESGYKVLHMWDAESGMIDSWHKYCQKQLRDNFHMLDERLIFSNTETDKNDYASKRLTYPLEDGDITAWDKLVSTLYTEEERHKIEWAIGSIVSGDSRHIQKFMVLYGAAGTGKSTILNIVQKLFDGYYSVFDAKALGSSSNSFALEAFKSNPLVAIQHDGDLSHIEDNTRLNSLVSHEMMTVNEKFKSTYANRFKCFLFMGTNKPVKITDAKSGLIRRLIDVTPSGEKLSSNEYRRTIKQVNFELGAIAKHCMDVYLESPSYYDDYIPVTMLGASNDFYNFVLDSFYIFEKENSTSLKVAWEMYKNYCEEAKVVYSLPQRAFKEELKNYFEDYKERYYLEDGTRVRSYYSGFLTDRFEENTEPTAEVTTNSNILSFTATKSIFDDYCANCPAQYASEKETPMFKWDNVTQKLSELDTSKLHYVKVPENHIVIDFDIPDESGNKCFEKNLIEASKWPPTYAELSKSEQGIHLHYIYTGDVSKLSRIYDDRIEVKIFTGKSSLRRKLTKCNELPIATISSGLPLKGDKKMVNLSSIETEKKLRALIKKNLHKEIHANTTQSIHYIKKLLDDAYAEGIKFDVSDLYTDILVFAMGSTHQANHCLEIVKEMIFRSDDSMSDTDNGEMPIVFFDIEVFPNLFIINWKLQGEKNPVVRMINPKPEDIEKLIKFRLIGFNNRRYDNHIVYAAMLGKKQDELYDISRHIIEGGTESKKYFFGSAYNLSYTDIYDFASAGNKMSLKKLEIKMGIHHQELGLPWDQPVPEELWEKVAEYCDNDVIATEAAFNYLKADWTARQILADLAGMSVNDTTNSLTTRIIFGLNKHPQNEFHYRNLAEPVYDLDKESIDFLKEACPEMMAEPHGVTKSLLPYFPGYKYEYGKSTYRGVVVGEGGRVMANTGMYTDVALLDIASQHPHSLIAEILFGVKFTKAFREIVEGRVSIKHEAWDEVNHMLDGKLTPYIDKVKRGEMTSKDLANALKTAINSVYGLTAARFENAFRDPRNIDNIVAKRGALFMIDLQRAVEERGFTVAHIKTDSIKIPNATPEIIDFVMKMGKRYGYTFEHEATYEKMCLVNDAVYIAKFATAEDCQDMYGYIPGDNSKNSGKWTATGTQFQIPYVFKKLFSKEPIEFDDLCETKSVTSSLYLDMNEGLPDVTDAEKTLTNTIKRAAKFGVNIRSDIKSGDGEVDDLIDIISSGHDYHFIGRVGQFCPIKPGCGGGLLMRETVNKKTGEKGYASATGAKGYRWLESETVKNLGMEDKIDRSYYDQLANNAMGDISQYGDFEWFISDDKMAPYFASENKDDCPFDVR